MTIISRLILNSHDHLKKFADKLSISDKGSKNDLLVRMADFLLTEKGLKVARANLPPKIVNNIYEMDMDSDEEVQ